MKLLSTPVLFAVAATLIASGTSVYAWHEQHRKPLLEIYVFALKSGRSLFIRTPDDRRILVDGGSNSEVIRHITRIIPFYSRRIDALIITNTESKNTAGLIDLIHRYSVHSVFIPEYTLENTGVASSTDLTYATFISTLQSLGIKIEALKRDDRIDLNNINSVHSPSVQMNEVHSVVADILFPFSPDQFQYSKASAPEILMNISHKNNSVLFMGNASQKIQKFITASFTQKEGTDVLIVSHSASPTLLSEELMNTFKPGVLIYSKLLTNETKKSKLGTSTKKKVADPLASILIENRFNIKEKGTAQIVSDGTILHIKTPD